MMSLQNLNVQRSAIMNNVGTALGLVLTSLGILGSYLSDNSLLKYICIGLCPVGLIVSILSIILFWLDYRLKELVLSVLSHAPIVEIHGEAITTTTKEKLKFKVRYNDSSIDNFHEYFLKLHNPGPKTIEKKDYKGQRITINFTVPILDVKITKPVQKDASTDFLSYDGKEVYISPHKFESHEWIEFRVFVNQRVKNEITLDASNSKLGFKVKKAEESHSRKIRISGILRVLRFVIIMILCASSIAVFILLENNSRGQFLFALLIILTIIFFYFVISGIIASFVNIIMGRNTLDS